MKNKHGGKREGAGMKTGIKKTKLKPDADRYSVEKSVSYTEKQFKAVEQAMKKAGHKKHTEFGRVAGLRYADEILNDRGAQTMIVRCVRCGEVHELKEDEVEIAFEAGCARCCGGTLEEICNGTTWIGFDVVNKKCVATPEGTMRCAKCNTLVEKQDALYSNVKYHLRRKIYAKETIDQTDL